MDREITTKGLEARRARARTHKLRSGQGKDFYVEDYGPGQIDKVKGEEFQKYVFTGFICFFDNNMLPTKAKKAGNSSSLTNKELESG